MQSEIHKHLSLLQQLSILDIGRAADLVWFQFGVVESQQDEPVASYALHMQCPWRITYEQKIVIGSADVYRPRLDYTGDPDLFEWDVAGMNALDEQVNLHFHWNTMKWTVERMMADHYGGFTISFSNGYQLESFIHETSDTELWRLLMRTEQQHFVVNGQGTEVV